MTLSPEFLTRPLAHRGLHAPGRPENSRAAFTAAIDAGYGIELDVQISRDRVAMVFHDDRLERLTDANGPTAERTAQQLAALRLKDSDQTIPSLADVLALIGGRTPLLIEVKDQDGALGANVGPLERATAAAIRDYGGPIALMSFNPHSVALMAQLCPDIPRGLTTCSFTDPEHQKLPSQCRAALAQIADAEQVGACFVSHEKNDLSAPRVAELKAQGLSVLTWTIRSALEEEAARKIADNITFEGYVAARP